METPVIIDVNNVYKSFRVYYDKGAMLKEQFINPGRSRYEEREILKGISFKVRQGETLALIGRNGCGKSTTLKMLTKILYPNKGTVTVNGKVSSLIELGAGFHPDMSGRENIYINASILGIKKEEVDKRIDEIIRFSELEEFIDNPIRTYSSGMYMRLAFSVAINVDADILLIDEILAVGDQAFQEKCIHKLEELRQSGITIVLVSHSMGQIKEIADRCIWIENGKIVEDGDTETVCDHYEEAMTRRREERDIFEEAQRKEVPEQVPVREEIDSKEKRQQEWKRRQEAFSARWKGGGTQGRKVAGICAMTLFILFTACQNVFGINYNIESELSFFSKEVGYVFFILGAVGLPMLLILLGFELLGRDYSSWDSILSYYKNTFLPAVVVWEIWVLVYQVVLRFFQGRPIILSVWVKEALLIKYVDISNVWTARFFLLMMLVAPFIARVLQIFSARSLRLLLILLWVFLFMFPGFDMYGQANGGEASFPFYSGTVCYVFYFCVGHMISRYSQRMLKGSREVLLFIMGFILTLWSQTFLDIRGISYLIKPTYYGVSIMAVIGFDLFVRVKIDEMAPRIAKRLDIMFAALVGVYFIIGPLQLVFGKYCINRILISNDHNLWQLIVGTLLMWLIVEFVAFGIMVIWRIIVCRIRS